MAAVYPLWISPYRDVDFERERQKSLSTFADRDVVLEAARIVCRGPLVRRLTRSGSACANLGSCARRALRASVVVVYTPRDRKCRIISMHLANALGNGFTMNARPITPRAYFTKLLDTPSGRSIILTFRLPRLPIDKTCGFYCP